MFWKIVGVVAALFALAFLGIMVLTAAGLTVAGLTVAAVVDELEDGTLHVVGQDGEQVDVDLGDGRITVTDSEGEMTRFGEPVEVDIRIPEITVQDGEGNSARIVVPGSGERFIPDVPRVHIEGQGFYSNGGFFLRPLFSVIGGFFNLAALVLIAVGVWLLVRNRRVEEKTPKAL